MMGYVATTSYWQRLTFFIGNTGAILPEQLHDLAREYGITGYCVKVADNKSPANDVELSSAEWVKKLRGSEQLPLGGWVYAYADDPVGQAQYHFDRVTQLTPRTANGNRVQVINAEISWRNGDPDATYLRHTRRLASTRMLALCPEGSEWGPVEGYDYEAFREADCRDIVQDYDGNMSPYDMFLAWRGGCQVFPQSYTRLMFGITSAPVGKGYWTKAIDKLEKDRLAAGMVRPLGGMIYLGENASDLEWAVAEISEAMFRNKLAKV